MDDPPDSTPPAHVETLLDAGDHETACARLRQLETADGRKTALRTLRERVDPATVAPVVDALEPFLTDDERAVRLSTVKLFAAVAGVEPDAVVASVPALVERLADESELYFVRARAAEALGRVAVERPAVVTAPERLAELTVGLSLDEPEVREKLAAALEGVALGDPGRLGHRVATLANHLDDDAELVRYHLCTALVAVGCRSPEALAEAVDALAARLDDDCPQVRGRAAEALGLVARADRSVAVGEKLTRLATDDEGFVADRARWAASALDRAGGEDEGGSVGTVGGIRETTDGAVEAITSPDADRVCPHCGLALPEDHPPFCPDCGTPF